MSRDATQNAASVPESPWKTASREAWDATYGEGDFDRRLAESVEKSAPCGCKWYRDGGVYRCLSHREATRVK